MQSDPQAPLYSYSPYVSPLRLRQSASVMQIAPIKVASSGWSDSSTLSGNANISPGIEKSPTTTIESDDETLITLMKQKNFNRKNRQNHVVKHVLEDDGPAAEVIRRRRVSFGGVSDGLMAAVPHQHAPKPSKSSLKTSSSQVSLALSREEEEEDNIPIFILHAIQRQRKASVVPSDMVISPIVSPRAQSTPSLAQTSNNSEMNIDITDHSNSIKNVETMKPQDIVKPAPLSKRKSRFSITNLFKKGESEPSKKPKLFSFLKK
ncbi:hypothetical protein HDU79_001737 [Rhizoclosmatium sp. JEL0117]|nr:hypothetical protein HDU79_001737 [Rhizoclosmatium sp. JEL0117]